MQDKEEAFLQFIRSRLDSDLDRASKALRSIEDKRQASLAEAKRRRLEKEKPNYLEKTRVEAIN